jgi:hypothetical protein
MTQSLKVGSSPVNSCDYDPQDQVCRADPNGGTGGAQAVSGAGGSEGAGNIEKTAEPEASLDCVLPMFLAAKACGEASLIQSLTGALICGLKLEELRQCLIKDVK